MSNFQTLNELNYQHQCCTCTCYLFTAKFTQVLESQRRERAEREMQRIRMLNADPFDATAQEQIAEAIRYVGTENPYA